MPDGKLLYCYAVYDLMVYDDDHSQLKNLKEPIPTSLDLSVF